MARPFPKRLAIVLAIACIVGASCNRSKALYFVPIGRFESSRIEDLKNYYEQKFSIKVEVLPLMPFDPSTLNGVRKQLIAEALVSQIKRSYPKESTDKNAVIIGLTDGDMYIEKMEWQFAFSYRAEDRFAIVASARMNPLSFGERPDPQRLASRLRKMITKNIGMLYFKKELNSNPKSVLYDNVMGLEELDHMGEEF